MVNKEYIKTAKSIIKKNGRCDVSFCNSKCPLNKEKNFTNCGRIVSSYFKMTFSDFVKIRGDKLCDYYKEYFEDWLKKNQSQLEFEF